MIEGIGYLAMAFVMGSFLVSDMKKLRIINTAGCLLFIAYGIFISSIPIIITNAFITLVNGYYLFIKKD